ncbi:MAG: RsmD family RNA methyltransferase [Pirellulaceae bacterium]|nr:RsmD family RNA methyltransferase [Pirellulaceae bacterium]
MAKHFDDTNDLPVQPIRRKAPPKLRPTRLRIVAGQLGGRYIQYNGDPDTRPMKEKTREAVFSLLGGYLHGKFAVDLFAGTGILGFEAVSRGAQGAILLELSRTTVSTILCNMRSLALESLVDVQNVDSLRWLRQSELRSADLPRCPWVVFCCPPYAVWQNQQQRLLAGLQSLYECMPPESQLVCETADSFDLDRHWPECDWDIRHYKPATVFIAKKPSEATS